MSNMPHILATHNMGMLSLTLMRGVRTLKHRWPSAAPWGVPRAPPGSCEAPCALLRDAGVERVTNLHAFPQDAASARQTFEETLEDDDDVPDLVPEDYNAGYVDAVVRGTAAHRLGKLLAYWDFLALMGVPGAKPDTAFFAQAAAVAHRWSSDGA